MKCEKNMSKDDDQIVTKRVRNIILEYIDETKSRIDFVCRREN